MDERTDGRSDWQTDKRTGVKDTPLLSSRGRGIKMAHLVPAFLLTYNDWNHGLNAFTFSRFRGWQRTVVCGIRIMSTLKLLLHSYNFRGVASSYPRREFRPGHKDTEQLNNLADSATCWRLSSENCQMTTVCEVRFCNSNQFLENPDFLEKKNNNKTHQIILALILQQCIQHATTFFLQSIHVPQMSCSSFCLKCLSIRQCELLHPLHMVARISSILWRRGEQIWSKFRKLRVFR